METQDTTALNLDALERRLAAVFSTEVDTIFGFVLARCGSRQLAEEIVSDTFAEATRVFRAGRCEEVTRGWLIDVSRKRLIDHWRRAERHRARLERAWRDRTAEALVDDISVDDAPILDALARVPERQRAALTLRYLDGLAVNEVAEALGATYKATESLLARARRALLAEYENGGNA